MQVIMNQAFLKTLFFLWILCLYLQTIILKNQN